MALEAHHNDTKQYSFHLSMNETMPFKFTVVKMKRFMVGHNPIIILLSFNAKLWCDTCIMIGNLACTPVCKWTEFMSSRHNCRYYMHRHTWIIVHQSLLLSNYRLCCGCHSIMTIPGLLLFPPTRSCLWPSTQLNNTLALSPAHPCRLQSWSLHTSSWPSGFTWSPAGCT